MLRGKLRPAAGPPWTPRSSQAIGFDSGGVGSGGVLSMERREQHQHQHQWAGAPTGGQPHRSDDGQHHNQHQHQPQQGRPGPPPGLEGAEGAGGGLGPDSTGAGLFSRYAWG